MSSRVLLVIGLLLFGIPLFIGLARTDLENDEAIYSYSVERMIVLHDWLTPRAIYDGADNPFLEKPPLKTWIVAAGQLAGLPRDEFGFRFFDPLFAIAAFAYVFLIGCRLANPLCGLVALLALFTFEPLVFEHGLRTNNMEAALLLTYCGGIYHFFRWAERGDSCARHAWAVAALFAFGFLTKFVAALFLPLVLVAAFLWRDDAVAQLRSRWHEWVWPAVAAVVTIAPWFLYQTAVHGSAFWSEILGHQIVTRFTGGLDPNHLQPWHYYLVRMWNAFHGAGAGVAAACGAAWLAWRAWGGRPWLARLVLVWWLLPVALISLGTSKLIHYSYPFVPPIALGIGFAAASWADFWRLPASLPTSRNRQWLERVLTTGAVVALAIAAWTAVNGPLVWKVFGVRVLRNATVFRPGLAGMAMLAATGSFRAIVRGIAMALLLFALPLPAYFVELQRLSEERRPLHAVRDCVLEQVPTSVRHDGALGPDWRVGGHSFFFYFRSLGRYRSFTDGNDSEIAARLFDPARQTPVILPRPSDPVSWPRLPAIDLGNYVIALPGNYAVCVASATRAGGRPFRSTD